MKRLAGVIVVLSAGWVIMLFTHTNTPTSDAVGGQERPSTFATERGNAAATTKPAAFDGARAMKYLNAICTLGPRISGTSSMKKQQEVIRKHFEELGAKLRFETFLGTQNSVRKDVEMTNIVVSFQPEKKRRVILCSHYDTRPIADQEPNPRDWQRPFVSANDGGSGVALLMELGAHMKEIKTQVGVDFVFFDGEEFVYKTDGPNKDQYFIGSQHFARSWRQSSNRCDYSAAILLDMIAGRDIRFPYETHSYNRFPELSKEIWGIARDLKCKAFVPAAGPSVMDDHLSLQMVGIPAIDIIDFEYPHWHRLSDTPENCSADSMEQVAKVLSVWLQRTK